VGCLFHHPYFNLDPFTLEGIDALPVHKGVRVLYGYDHPGDAGLDNLVDTGWRLAMMAARLEIYEEGGTPGL